MTDEQIYQLMQNANDKFKNLLAHFEALQNEFNEVTKKVKAIESALGTLTGQVNENDKQIRRVQEFHGIE